MNLFKNLDFIYKKVLKQVVIVVSIFSGLCLILGYKEVALSAAVGTFGSWIVFYRLMLSQVMILKTKKKQLAYSSFFTRYLIYTIFISTAFFLKNYLNLFILLVFLLTFHGFYIAWEIKLNLKKMKKRKTIKNS